MRLVELATAPRTAPRHQLSALERLQIMDTVCPTVETQVNTVDASDATALALIPGTYALGTTTSAVSPFLNDAGSFDVSTIGVSAHLVEIWDQLATVILEKAIVPATARDTTEQRHSVRLVSDTDQRLEIALQGIMSATTERDDSVEQGSRLRYRYPKR